MQGQLLLPGWTGPVRSLAAFGGHFGCFRISKWCPRVDEGKGKVLWIVSQLPTPGSVKLRSWGRSVLASCSSALQTRGPCPAPSSVNMSAQRMERICAPPFLQPWGLTPSPPGNPIFCAPFSPTLGSQEPTLAHGGRQDHSASVLPEIWDRPEASEIEIKAVWGCGCRLGGSQVVGAGRRWGRVSGTGLHGANGPSVVEGF